MVIAQALFRLLKGRAPELDLDVLAPVWSLPVVARMPEVRRGIASSTDHGEIGLAKRRRIGVSLRLERYARAIVLPRSFKAALIPWFARIPVRTGFRGEHRHWLINDIRPFDSDHLDQTVKRFVALGVTEGEPLPAELPQPRLDVSAENQARLCRDLSLEQDRPVIALMPGAAYGPAKRWPIPRFTELAQRLAGAGFYVWVLGSVKDRAAGDAITRNGAARNLCGKTSLEDVVDLLACCDQAVSNDSGLMHIAAAAGCHVHGIYGSSSPKFTPPLTNSRDIHEIEIDCRPCFERECPLGHLRCLNDISVDRIFAKVIEKSS
jgi:heptosyltransferase-2